MRRLGLVLVLLALATFAFARGFGGGGGLRGGSQRYLNDGRWNRFGR